MPRLPINYANTVIYKLCCLDPSVTEIYIGHSTDFTVRKGCHKRVCNNPKGKKYNRKVYEFIRANGGWNNWDMVLVEKYPCNDVLEAKQKEQFYIMNLHSTLNSSIPNQTLSEWKEINKEYIKEQGVKYRELNKPVLAEYNKIYTQRSDVRTHKNELARNRYAKNKEILCEKAREKYAEKKLLQKLS